MSIYDPKINAYWIHVPKNCGTSARQAIWPKEDHDHRSLGQMIDHFGVDKLSSAFGFAIVRNPYDRIISAYEHLKHAHKFNSYSDFDDFILNDFYKSGSLHISHTKSAIGAKAHFRQQTEYIQDKRLTINFLLRYENIEEDWQILCNKLGTFFPLQTTNTSPRKSRNWQDYFVSNREKKLLIVNTLYKDDFENYDYKMET